MMAPRSRWVAPTSERGSRLGGDANPRPCSRSPCVRRRPTTRGDPGQYGEDRLEGRRADPAQGDEDRCVGRRPEIAGHVHHPPESPRRIESHAALAPAPRARDHPLRQGRRRLRRQVGRQGPARLHRRRLLYQSGREPSLRRLSPHQRHPDHRRRSLGVEPAALAVLYEDDALLFVNKPPDIIVARSRDPIEATLFDLVSAHAGKIFLMQRLDRGTSGVMFFSKLASINARLTRHFETKLIRKRYLALTEGELAEAQTIDAALARIGPISFGVRDHGKRAITGIAPRRSN